MFQREEPRGVLRFELKKDRSTRSQRVARSGRWRNGDELASWKIFHGVETSRRYTLGPSAISSGAEGGSETACNFLYYVKSFYERTPRGRYRAVMAAFPWRPIQIKIGPRWLATPAKQARFPRWNFTLRVSFISKRGYHVHRSQVFALCFFTHMLFNFNFHFFSLSIVCLCTQRRSFILAKYWK